MDHLLIHALSILQCLLLVRAHHTHKCSLSLNEIIVGGSGISYTLPIFLDIIEFVTLVDLPISMLNCHLFLDRSATMTAIAAKSCSFGLSETLVSHLARRSPSLIHTFRLIGHIGWISATLLKAIQLSPSSLSISICVYVTGSSLDSFAWDEESSPSASTEDNPEIPSGTSNSLASILSSPIVKVTEGRPDLRKLLREEAESASGRMSVRGTYLHCTLWIY